MLTLVAASIRASDDPPLPSPGAAAAAAADDDDATLQPAEPDFRLINLPTTLRLPLFKSNFDLTHRFGGNLRHGSFSDQASSLFGIDEGATVGFEYRVAVARHLSDRVRIVVRTRYVSEIEELRRLGADEVIPEELETSVEIFANKGRVYMPMPATFKGEGLSLSASGGEALVHTIDVNELKSIWGK